MNTLAKLFKEFLIIGSTSFGGYMALIAMVREKFVSKEKLIDDEVIAEGIAISSILPGPVAVNVVSYVGYVLAGIRGAMTSVIAVLIPSLVLVIAFAELYFAYGEFVNAGAILKGMMPVIVALLLSVATSIGLKNVTKLPDVLLLVLAIIVSLVIPGYAIIVGILLLGAIMGIFLGRKSRTVTEKMLVTSHTRIGYLIMAIIVFIVLYLIVPYFFSENINARLFSEFASISLTLFGGGYVMVPILKGILVDQTQWFSLSEFLAGISVGQITPGPILISAAFFGYKLNGITGAVIATVAIFFPSSILMIIISKFFNQYKTNHYVEAAISGIKPAVVGLIVAAAISIFKDYWSDDNQLLSILILVISFILFFRFKFNPAIVVLISGLVGYLAYSV